jgi:hypothetical protein
MTINDPVFLSRYTRQGSVCAFLYGRRMNLASAIKLHRKTGGR